MRNIFIFIALMIVSLPHANASNHIIKAVIFDCDGTLVDTESVLCEAWKFAFQQQGYNLTEREYWEIIHQNAIAGHPLGRLIIAEVGCKILNKKCEEELLQDMENYIADVKTKNRGFPPVEATLNFLHDLAKLKEDLGIKIGLASGNSKKNILFHLKDFDVVSYFDVILSGSEDLSDYQDDEGTNKPKPYIYQQAAKLLGVLPSECVAIEDSGTGVYSAASAGCITIAIPNIGTTYHDFSRAHLKIESFSGIDVQNFFELIRNAVPNSFYTKKQEANIKKDEIIFDHL